MTQSDPAATEIIREARRRLRDTECPLDDVLRAMAAARDISAEAGPSLDRMLVHELMTLRDGLAVARQQQQKFRDILETFTASPWHPAIFVALTSTPKGERAIVVVGGAHRVVAVEESMDASTLQPGDEVFVSKDLAMLTARSSYALLRCGDMAPVSRLLPDGRIVVRSREEEIVVNAAAALRGSPPAAGDLVRWDRSASMAFETMKRDDGQELFLEETPHESFDSVGGLDTEIGMLKREISLHVHHAETARTYRATPKRSVLMVGPPGTGKTLIARGLASWLAGLSPSGRSRFMSIKPAELHSIWYSQTEANYRRAFRLAREASEEHPDIPVVIFLDEVDSVAGMRGQSHMPVDDRVLTAIMAELDGFESRGNVLVVSASNRPDAIDPALNRPGRLRDVYLQIGRPRRGAALEIFGKHLEPDIPYAEQTGGTAAEWRHDLIDAVASHIYAPNREPLACVTRRDGVEHLVQPADVVSGAVIANIARGAKERACHRDVETGEVGLRLEDLIAATDAELRSTVAALTPTNCRSYLDDLPQDVDIVRVEPTGDHRSRRSTRYREVA